MLFSCGSRVQCEPALAYRCWGVEKLERIELGDAARL